MADKIIKGLLFDGNVNLIAINGTELIRDAKTRHGLSRVCTAAHAYDNVRYGCAAEK